MSHALSLPRRITNDCNSYDIMHCLCHPRTTSSLVKPCLHKVPSNHPMHKNCLPSQLPIEFFNILLQTPQSFFPGLPWYDQSTSLDLPHYLSPVQKLVSTALPFHVVISATDIDHKYSLYLLDIFYLPLVIILNFAAFANLDDKVVSLFFSSSLPCITSPITTD